MCGVRIGPHLENGPHLPNKKHGPQLGPPHSSLVQYRPRCRAKVRQQDYDGMAGGLTQLLVTVGESPEGESPQFKGGRRHLPAGRIRGQSKDSWWCVGSSRVWLAACQMQHRTHPKVLPSTSSVLLQRRELASRATSHPRQRSRAGERIALFDQGELKGFPGR